MVQPDPFKNNNDDNVSEMEFSQNSRKRSGDGDLDPSQSMLNKNKKINTNTISSNSTQNNSLLNSTQSITNKNTLQEIPKLDSYPENIRGPYKVIIQSTNSNDTNQKPLHAINVAKLITTLYPNKIDKLQHSGKNTLVLTTYDRKIANDLIQLDILKQKNLVAFIPSAYIYKKVIIKNIPTDMSEKEIKDNLVLDSPVSTFQIFRVMRFNRRITQEDNKIIYVPTGTVLITYIGQVFPQHAYLYQLSIPVHLYIPKVKLCTNCYRYGHTKTNCKSKTRCYKCGKSDHTQENCDINSDKYMCINCHESNHLPTDKNCKANKREQSILQYAIEKTVTIKESKLIHKNFSNNSKRFRFSDFPDLNNHMDLLENTNPSSTFPKSFSQALQNNSNPSRDTLTQNTINKNDKKSPTSLPPTTKNNRTTYSYSSPYSKEHLNNLYYSNGQPLPNIHFASTTTTTTENPTTSTSSEYSTHSNQLPTQNFPPSYQVDYSTDKLTLSAGIEGIYANNTLLPMNEIIKYFINNTNIAEVSPNNPNLLFTPPNTLTNEIIPLSPLSAFADNEPEQQLQYQ